jgi:hypothetical protein
VLLEPPGRHETRDPGADDEHPCGHGLWGIRRRCPRRHDVLNTVSKNAGQVGGAGSPLFPPPP